MSLKRSLAVPDLRAVEASLKRARVAYTAGDLVWFEHQNKAKDPPFSIVSTSGRILSLEEDADLLKHMHKMQYVLDDCDTWVFASTDPSHRNPKFTPAKYGFRSGDGEAMQVRGVAAVSKHGQFRFLRFKPEDEWRAICSKSKMTKAQVLVRSNRMKDAENAAVDGNEICLISDDIYFTSDGCDARIKWAADKLAEKNIKNVVPCYVFPGEPTFESVVVHIPVVAAATRALAPVDPATVESDASRIRKAIANLLQTETPDVARAVLGGLMYDSVMTAAAVQLPPLVQEGPVTSASEQYLPGTHAE